MTTCEIMQNNTDKANLVQPNVEANQDWTIFLVDDDMDDLALARRILENIVKKDNIISLPSGDALLAELKRRKFYDDLECQNKNHKCLIILDMHMPKDNGISVLQELKDNPYTCDIPVLMLTQDADTGFIETTYHMHANGYLTKPLTDSHMSVIKNVFAKGRDWKN